MGSEELKPWLPCLKVRTQRGYQLGFEIGQRFADMIQSRFSHDPALHSEILPFAATEVGQKVVASLSSTNRGCAGGVVLTATFMVIVTGCARPYHDDEAIAREKFSDYWDEMRGTAAGAGVPFLQVLLINMRKEIAPFLPRRSVREKVGEADQCSTVLLHTDSVAVIAHNEDADVSLLQHVYLVHAELEDGLAFMAYTYAGELPSCAFGFNSYGVVFTLNAVPLAPEEAVAGGISRNFVSRDLLEAHNIEDAIKRVCLTNLAVGHNYNIMDINECKLVTIETASKGRVSKRDVNVEPIFHANMYLHLPVNQVPNETSLYRQKRADCFLKLSRPDMLTLLGDVTDEPYPVYMQGPKLITLCTVVFDLHARTWTVYRGNPREQTVYSDLPLVLPHSPDNHKLC